MLGQLRAGYARWVEDNAGLSFGDGLPGNDIPHLAKEATIRDRMRVSLHAAVECTRTNLAADFRAEASQITLPALVIAHAAPVPRRAARRRPARIRPIMTVVRTAAAPRSPVPS
ncbi:MAG TPA: hypothetical protein VMC03_11035 [Streptosporangiaceae bacterium]|nr:hypothetical protein [Streptosporangiaceae bacterium]